MMVNLIINIVESGTSLLIANVVYKKKLSKLFVLFTVISSIAITIFDIYSFNTTLFLIIDFILIGTYSYLLEKKSIVLTAFLPIVSSILLFLANYIALLLGNLVFKIAPIIIIIISKIIYLILIMWIGKLISRIKHFNNKLVFIINLTVAIILVTLSYLGEKIYINNITIIDAYVLICLLLFLAMCIMLLFNESRKEQEKSHEKELIINSLNEKERHYQEIDKNIKETQKIKHDFKHILVSLLNELNEQNYLQIRNILDEQITNINLNNQAYITGNNIIDLILNLNNERLIHNHILLYCDQLNNTLPMSNADLSVLVGNLVENAIENCGGNNEKKIIISNGIYNEFYYFIIKNTISTSILTSNPNLKSSKNNSLHHGIGLESCKEIVHKYNGSIHFLENKQFFEVKILLPLPDHYNK